MGDLSAEPSMEDILSSIKRIIADENEGAARARRAVTRPIQPEPAPAVEQPAEEVLELREPIAAAEQPPKPSVSHAFTAAAQTAAASAAHAAAASATPEPQPQSPVHRATAAERVSSETVQATRGALDALSRLVVKPEPDADNTLEGLVREMLRPMLSEWLDRNLPGIVEQAVAREIAKITAAQG